VGDSCVTRNEQLFSYVMARTSYIVIWWRCCCCWWYPLSTRPTRRVEYL